MANLDYSSPSSVKEVVKILTAAKGKAKVMAGGTDLLVQLRAGRFKASTIVDVKNISELRTIKKEKNGFTIGAAVSGAELGAHKAVN
ncbi:MAG: FAD binding domain-containing protein, partial [Rhodospirillales bacterium]